MDKILKLAELISTDIRSRANANIIRSVIDGIDDNIILDFTGITFISRSFTDELCNIIEEHKNLSLANASDFVQSMINTVSEGRKHKRVFIKDNAEIKEFNDMNSLASFLATI